MKTLSEKIWNPTSPIWNVMILASILLLFMLGARELWTQEWRWADISMQMIYSGDYWHPYLAGAPYYDKPLLSYWIVIFFSKLLGGMSEWSLRLPAALAGLIAIFCTYRLGNLNRNHRTGLIAASLLTTTFYFVFWARTGNTDMINLAGTLLAMVWYFSHREKPNFFNYSVFFFILAVAALFKGLLAIVVAGLAILPDLLHEQQWKKSLRWSVLPALLPAISIYCLPFLISMHANGQHYNESGFYEVYQENIVRYFAPFDHKGAIYSYFLYLPAYIFPWTLFFIPALFALRNRWKTMAWGSRWMIWSFLIIFIFFTLSGSRRDYYTLPMVPFAILITADWIASGAENLSKRFIWAGRLLALSFILLLLNFGVLTSIYYSDGGMRPFARDIHAAAIAIKPWNEWKIIFLGTDNKLVFYLQSAEPPQIFRLPSGANESTLQQLSLNQLQKMWPVLLQKNPNTIFITRASLISPLSRALKHKQVIRMRPVLGARLLGDADPGWEPVALLPEK